MLGIVDDIRTKIRLNDELLCVSGLIYPTP